MKEFVLLSLYLYVCFGAIILYTVALLQAHGIPYEPWGFAALKALILAKFILIGNLLPMGRRSVRKPLVYSVLLNSLIYLCVLVGLSIFEEICVGYLHGRSINASIGLVGGGNLLQIAATCLLLWLILVPVAALRQVRDRMGKGYIHRMFFVA